MSKVIEWGWDNPGTFVNCQCESIRRWSLCEVIKFRGHGGGDTVMK